MRVGVLGMWHLGSVTAACLASLGFEVVGIDANSQVIEELSLGKPPLFEPGLEKLIHEGISGNQLTFSSNYSDAMKGLDVLWVCIDTPVDDEDNADADKVLNEIRRCIEELPTNSKVIISSQLPVGSIAKLESYCKSNFFNKNIKFSSSPENLRLGDAISIFLNPDRIIIGVRSDDEKRYFYDIFKRISSNLEWMLTESAEMTKHAINSFLANSIVFANEIAILCEKVGADAKEVERGLKTEARIGPKAYLSPGGAFAGGTLARDVQFLNKLSLNSGLSTYLLASIRASNDHHKNWVKDKLLSQYSSLSGKNIALWGLVYKAGTSTLRRSEAVELGNWLIANGAFLHVFDPSINDLPGDWGCNAILHKSHQECLSSADALVIGPQFKENQFSGSLDLEGLKDRKLVVIDPFRNFFKVFGKADADYFAVGLSKQT